MEKVLLMGRAGAGKTSMCSIVFANYLAHETNRLNPTNQVEMSNLRFLGSLVLNLWDCGGQDVFLENYFDSQVRCVLEVLVAADTVPLRSLGPSARAGGNER